MTDTYFEAWMGVHVCKGVQMGGYINGGCMYVWMGVLVTGGCIGDRWVYGWIYGWVHVWVGGCMDEYVYGRMYVWVDV